MKSPLYFYPLSQYKSMITDNLNLFYTLITIDKPVAAIDYGTTKLGLALSDPSLRLAFPLKVIMSSDPSHQLMQALKIATEYGAQGFILGIPLAQDGSATTQSKVVRKFAEYLEQHTQLPIFLQDERLSTRAANYRLQDLGFTRKERDKLDDKVAASIILEYFLERLAQLRREL